MAGSRLIQAPLPWLPGGAREIAPGVGLLALAGGGGQMWVHGMAAFTWGAGDEAARRLAAVQVTQLKAATQKQVAAALGADHVTGGRGGGGGGGGRWGRGRRGRSGGGRGAGRGGRGAGAGGGGAGGGAGRAGVAARRRAPRGGGVAAPAGPRSLTTARLAARTSCVV